MSDPDQPFRSRDASPDESVSDAPASDGELLSAYLSGDLPADEADALERRLEDDPDLTERLENTSRVVMGLRDLESVEPPAGYSERLAARLTEERATLARERDETPAAVTTLEEARTRRSPRESRWAGVLAAAATVAVLGLVAIAVVQGFGAPGDEVADPAALDAPAEEEAAVPEGPEEEAVPEAPVEEAVPEEEVAEEPAPDTAEEPEVLTDADVDEETPEEEDVGITADPEGEPRAATPTVLDETVELADEAAAVARYAELAEVDGLRGLPVAAADERAAEAAAVLRDSAVEPAGVAANACLDAVAAGIDAVVVPARVESASFRGALALAYVVVHATPGSQILDRGVAVLVEPVGCAELARIALD